MQIDPRNPPLSDMVRTDSDHEFHRNLYKTLNLLCIGTAGEPVYFVIEGLSVWEDKPWPDHINALQESSAYFYEEHTCPTNFIRIPMIFHDGDADPHGVFEFVEAVWMTTEYVAADKLGGKREYLAEVFPQLTPIHRP